MKTTYCGYTPEGHLVTDSPITIEATDTVIFIRHPEKPEYGVYVNRELKGIAHIDRSTPMPAPYFPQPA